MGKLWVKLVVIMGTVILAETIWFPSQSSVGGNEWADKMVAKSLREATLINHESVPLTAEASRSIQKENYDCTFGHRVLSSRLASSLCKNCSRVGVSVLEY